jgi:hypothetical protein
MNKKIVREPRWPALVAMLAASGVYLAMPEPMFRAQLELLGIISLLMIPIIVSHRRGRFDIAKISTCRKWIDHLAMIASLIFLIQGMPKHAEAPGLVAVGEHSGLPIY